MLIGTGYPLHKFFLEIEHYNWDMCSKDIDENQSVHLFGPDNYNNLECTDTYYYVALIPLFWCSVHCGKI